MLNRLRGTVALGVMKSLVVAYLVAFALGLMYAVMALGQGLLNP
jgi:hypothetical protein